MDLDFAPLYDEKTILKEFKKNEPNPRQKSITFDWIQKLKNKELEGERKNYDLFRDTILIELLGYPKGEIMFEEKRVEFSIKDIKSRTHVIFEAKGAKTKDLFARQGYEKKEQEHPVIQTNSNMQRFAPPARYGVCTNYNDFVLLDRDLGITKCHRFKFTDIEKNPEKLNEFLGIFSYSNLVEKKDLEILYDKSVNAQKEFTDDFYKLFHETRLMLIREFQENTKERVTKNDAIYYSQIFLNRLIFIFFVEDKENAPSQLFGKRIFKKLEHDQIIDISTQVYQSILELFVAFDIGSSSLNVPAFNGELFGGTPIPPKISFSDLKDSHFFAKDRQNSKLLKTTKLNEEAQKIINSHPKLSPIISNLLIMESFDFATEVDVNILGHMFEQSISDLEELRKSGDSRRKKEGVYYTPDHITEFICKNSIIQHLSKSNMTSIPELIDEYVDNIEELEEKFRAIKIVDPACGSGAFLNKAVEILLEIHKAIFDFKDKSGKYKQGKNMTFGKWTEEEEARKVIEYNIFGADINKESVEITKLSLFLKLASGKRKLFSLSKNIIVGNSIVSDTSVDGRGFSWEDKFPDVIPRQFSGFDVVIGNPPYVQLSMQKATSAEEKKYLIDRFGSSMGRLNTFGFFTKLGIDLLKEGGYLGFIIPNTVLSQDYYEELREMILNSCKIKTIVNFSDLPFKDAVVENVILILKKTADSKDKNIVNVLGVNHLLNFVKQNEVQQKIFLESRKKTFGIFWNNEILSIIKKIDSKSAPLSEFLDVNQAIALRHDREKWVTYDKSKENTKPLLVGGRNIGRYSINWDGTYLIYDLSGIHSCKTEAIFLTKEKIIFRRVANRPIGTMDTSQFYGLHTLVVMNLKSGVNYNIRYLLAIFNSKLMSYYFQKVFASTKTVFSEIGARQVEELPIKIAEDKSFQKIINLVNRIIYLNKHLVKNLEEAEKTKTKEEIQCVDNEIDETVCEIYGITEEEQKIIERDVLL